MPKPLGRSGVRALGRSCSEEFGPEKNFEIARVTPDGPDGHFLLETSLESPL